MQRLKNYVLWLAIGAFILDVLIYTSVITVTDKQEIEMMFQRLLELLVLTGILNNPSKGTGLKDK